MKYINKRPEFAQAISSASNDTTHSETLLWQATSVEVPERLARISQEAIDVYLNYGETNGVRKTNGLKYWQVANAYTAIALHDTWSGNQKNYKQVATGIRDCDRSNHDGDGFINDWNDDSLWWALCCLYVYALRGQAWFLERAVEVWKHVRHFVCERGQESFEGMDMEGAVFWKSKAPDEDHVNAISTALFAELSVRLALILLKPPKCTLWAGNDNHIDDHPISRLGLLTPDEYMDHARRSLGWILRCRYIPQQALVLDHIELRAQKAVDWRFTYNTGVTLSACALLNEATGEEEYMLLACHMALKSISRKLWVEENGVLTERTAWGRGKHDPLENNDAIGFKSVLIRSLGVLFDVIRRTGCRTERASKTRAAIRQFVNVNFRSQLTSNTDGGGVYGPWWDGPFEHPTEHSQMAVLDVMAAVVLVNSKPDHDLETYSVDTT